MLQTIFLLMSTYVQWPDGHFESYTNVKCIGDLKWKVLPDDFSLTPSIDLVFEGYIQRHHQKVRPCTYHVVTCTAWVFWLEGVFHVRIGHSESSHHVKVFLKHEEEMALYLYNMLGSLEDETGVRLYQPLNQDLPWLIATYLQEFHHVPVSGVWLE